MQKIAIKSLKIVQIEEKYFFREKARKHNQMLDFRRQSFLFPNTNLGTGWVQCRPKFICN